MVIVRENHEDLYAGVEYEEGKDETLKLRDFIEETEGTQLREDIGVTVKAISIFGTQRIVREAFEYAKAYDRKKVTAVHKANIMKHTDGLFLKVAREVAEKEYGTRASSSRTGSWTTCATSSSPVRRSTTCWCCRTSTATSCPTSPPA